ncbi:MAG: NAD(P)/FAD-dependent oxidoreductase [Planctomycetes bacterium]|nr:NAD(P)/FAD-dependent oxidoreductase [Planctomycetota bacterium]
MPRDFLTGARDAYDVIVIGGGLGGLTCANLLGRSGHRVLLLEQHYKLGGLATWFKRPGGRIFDISLHGFPVGMIKSCRRYWTSEIADSIVPLRRIRFDNPMFSLTTTFDRVDFTRLLIDRFRLERAAVESFFERARGMRFYDDQSTTVGDLFESFFPGREDVVRLLMEPITYANGSTLEDPAIAYGIVFSNFMSKGVYIYEGGTDGLIARMGRELRRNGVDIRIRCPAERIVAEGRRVRGVVVRGRFIGARAVVSNASLHATLFRLLDRQQVDPAFLEEAESVRLNNSSTQVYMALKPEESIDESTGDLLFSSTARSFRTESLLGRDITSRTFSFYYPRTRPHAPPRHVIVSSTNARYEDWVGLPDDEYARRKRILMETTLDALDRYVPRARDRIEHVEAATPRTFERYTGHPSGTSFGTKFEGLKVSRGVPEQVRGLYHAGSVGIIMSGWLGAINYGVIVANEVENQLMAESRTRVPANDA